MPQLMLYLAATAALASVAALCADHACASLGRPRRFVWLAALLVSFALPGGAILAGRGSANVAPAPASAAESAPATRAEPAATDAPATVTAPVTGQQTTLPLTDFSRLPLLDPWTAAEAPRRARIDEVLIAFWIATSAGVIVLYCIGLTALTLAARRWPRRRLANTDVLVSARLGPAIFGLFRPRIVVPRWLSTAAAEEQALVLEHERAHAAAHDPLSLAAGLFLVALAPWNPVLWWQLSRLRASIELDCDARVVRGGASPIAYSETLLAMRQRRTAAPLPAVALTEPASRLEGRIRALLATPSRLRRRAAFLSIPLAVVVLVFAGALTPPPLLAQDGGALGRDPLTGMALGGERVVILVDTSASMLDDRLVDILRRRNMPPGSQDAAPKWRHVVDTVERITVELDSGTQLQIIGFAEQASTLTEGSNGGWVTVRNRRGLESAIDTLRNTRPAGPTNLFAAMNALRSLDPAPDNVYLLVDGLPTTSEVRPVGAGVTGSQRMDLFYRALRAARLDVPINVVLFPMEGDPWAAPLYWELALRTRGSLVTAPLSAGARAPTPLDVPDDDHVIFIVDTSGSMQSYAWERVREHMLATLEAYSGLQGFQVMNDEGAYLLENYRGRWLPNTPAMRSAVVDGMRSWTDFSDSSPREGILAAIDTFSDPERKVSLYVYSDDFSRGSIAAVAREIARRNATDDAGRRRVRINAIALPVFWQVYGELHTAAGFAVLMRDIATESGGRFIGLTSPLERAVPAPGTDRAANDDAI